MWAALEHSGWVTTLGLSPWLYGLVSVVHYSTMFFCVGTIVLLDLRILGVADRNQAVSLLAGQLRPWTWIAIGCAVVSGSLLFATQAGGFASAAPFRLKVLVVVLAVVSVLAIEWSLPAWGRAPVMPITARLAALISIVLWLGAILVSVEIPALTGLG